MVNLRKFGLCLLGTTVLYSGTVLAQTPDLFEPAPTTRLRPSLPVDATASTPVRLNRRALSEKSFNIDLFGENVTAVRARIEDHDDRTVWVGHLSGSPADTVVVTIRGDIISGFIQKDNRVFQLGRTKSDGTVSLIERDTTTLFDEDEDHAEEVPQTRIRNHVPAPSGDSQEDGNTQQDIMFAYTEAACDYAGGCEQLEADLATAVADTNTTYMESGINITMNMVGAVLVDYVEGPNDTGEMRSAIREYGDGEMDEIHELRDELSADIVSLIYRGDGCGRAYIAADESTAFSVVDIGCVSGRTLTHEVGHIQGARHNRTDDSTGSTSTGYNYGYRRCSDGGSEDVGEPYFRTVMGYSCGPTRIGRFSNPHINYEGVPLGIDPEVEPLNGTWNARTLNESAEYVASFRTKAETVPMAPSQLSAVYSSYNLISLSWSDNSDNETAFYLEASLDSKNWSTVARMSVDKTFFTDTDLTPGTVYYYRLRAQNSEGASGYSNVLAAKTTQPAKSEDVANSASTQKGIREGGYTETHFDDGILNTLTEVPKDGGQALSRRWGFDVTGGAGSVVLTANVWVSGQEDVNFTFSDSRDGPWTPMFTVNENDPDTIKTFTFPAGTSGPIHILAQDAGQVEGEEVDTLFVDHLLITSYTGNDTSPPLAPSGLSVGAIAREVVNVNFRDNSDNETGFEIWRSNYDPQGDCNAGSAIATLGAHDNTSNLFYQDVTTEANTNYWYWAKAYNSVGDGEACSNVASVTTPSNPLISMSARYVQRGGRHIVHLSWEATSDRLAFVYRDDKLIARARNTSYLRDRLKSFRWGEVFGIRMKLPFEGEKVYEYKVCKKRGRVCSDPVQVKATF